MTIQQNSSLFRIVMFSLFTVFFLQACKSSGPKNDPDPLTLDYLMSLSDEELMERDSDGDQLSDFDEINVYETNPLQPDSDSDGLTDYDESFVHGTNPTLPDTDSDGISDGEEVHTFGTNPLSNDTDSDGLSDCMELKHTVKSECEDSTFSGPYDGGYLTDPAQPDTDRDGLTDCQEVLHTNKTECETTGFSAFDGGYGTDPIKNDTDGDGLIDGEEVDMGSNPLDSNDPPSLTADDLRTINFGFDQSDITTQSAQKLAENIELLQEYDGVSMRIDAYTDHVGGDQYNLRLSVRRANSVADFYISNGISENRIERRGLGKAPVACSEEEKDTNTPGCEKNRRAETIPVQQKK
jgi:outer membrane protein OmpA-like peptidoglycan-associated protein